MVPYHSYAPPAEYAPPPAYPPYGGGYGAVTREDMAAVMAVVMPCARTSPMAAVATIVRM